ncbi:MAG: sugar phosphate nucleotidyltransferase [Candidatus ainarchaeum sp.]|nr:sugar phosphate nucleotidyltransferase [Candidatus ainarchaeum sp.]
MKAIILAGGEGKRMHPLTYTRPKAMVYAAGRPLLWHVLMEVKKAGVSEATVVVKYQKERIIDYFKQNDPGIKVEFVEQGENYGTGAALLSAKESDSDRFLVVAGDIVTEASVMKSVMDAHDKWITVAAKRSEKPERYGVLQVKNGLVSAVEEKSENPKGNLVNTSVYVMDRDVFNELEKISPSLRGEYELTDALVGAKCVETEGFWMDVGYPWELFDAQDYLLSKMETKTGKVENCTVKGKLIMEDGAEIVDSYVDEGAHYIGAGTRIGPHSYLRGNNSIGRNCEIGESTTIKNSALFDRVKAKHLSYIGDSVIGENVNFGSGTQTANYRFDEGTVNMMTDAGWVNTGRKKMGCVVGDNVKFGVLSCVMPGKTIGNDCWIGSGVSVDENVGIAKHVLLKQEKKM